MTDLNHWLLADVYTVHQAALLQLGDDPGDSLRSRGYDATLHAFKQAVINGKLKASKRHSASERGWAETSYSYDVEPDELAATTVNLDDSDWGTPVPGPNHRQDFTARYGITYHPELDLDLTTVTFEDVRAWLATRGQTTGFFFDNMPVVTATVSRPPKGDPLFAFKLEAAILAQAALVAELNVNGNLGGKTMSDWLDQWLTERRHDLGLAHPDGSRNTNAIEQCTAVVNPKRGGPAITPG